MLKTFNVKDDILNVLRFELVELNQKSIGFLI